MVNLEIVLFNTQPPTRYLAAPGVILFGDSEILASAPGSFSGALDHAVLQGKVQEHSDEFVPAVSGLGGDFVQLFHNLLFEPCGNDAMTIFAL